MKKHRHSAQRNSRRKNIRRNAKKAIGPSKYERLEVRNLLAYNAPTLDVIPDQNILEDHGLLEINLTGITDGDNDAVQEIAIKVESSDELIIPIFDNSLDYTSDNNFGLIRLTPVADEPVVGPDITSVNITVTVTDGGLDGVVGSGGDDVSLKRVFKVNITPINDYPTLDPIQDILVDEDTGPHTVDLTGITAGGRETQELQIKSITSNYPELIPNPTWTYTSANTTGTLEFTSVPNMPPNFPEYATITVTVEDAGFDNDFDTAADNRQFSRNFKITVNPVNDDPTLDPISPDPLIINEDAAQQTVYLFGITAGAGGESQRLRVLASSDNPALLPNPVPNYVSPNSFGSLKLKPLADQFGVATITVTVEDWGLDQDFSTPGDNGSISRTFTVIVNPVNDLPTLDPLNDMTVDDDENQVVDLSGITAGGGEIQPLRVTASSDNTALIPNPSVIYTSDNPTGSIAFTPVLGLSGTAIITVTVEDGGLDLDLNTPADNLSFSRSFVVTVSPVNDAPTLDPLNDLVIDENAPEQVVNLTGITAGGREIQPLRVTATSNNTSLIPNPSVNYTSASTTGLLRFTPVDNQFGVAFITVTVEDGGLDGKLSTSADNATFSRTFKVTVNSVNDPPTLDPIPDRTINEDAGLQIVNLSGITAGGGESQPLRVTAVSSNTVLIPNPAVSYTSASTTGSISFTPAANLSGTSIITVTVEDGGLDNNLSTTADNLTFSRTFLVTVNPVNDLPTLNPLSDLTINEDAGQQTVNLSGISAGGGESQPLRVTAISSKPALIPNPNVNYTSADPTGAISFTPVPNQFGVAIITVTVEDGGFDGNLSTTADNAFFSRSFLVTVNPINDSPTLDPLSNRTINEDAGPQTVNLTGITAGPSESQPLRVTATSSNLGLIPNPIVNYTSAAQTGTLTFTPVANQSGIATITVTVEDGGNDGDLSTPGDNLSVTRTFTVTVLPVNDPPTLNPINDLVLNEDAPLQSVNLTGITAGGGESQPLRVTATSSNTALIPSPTVIYTPNNDNGVLTFTPVANQSGVSQITVTVEDGGLDGNLATPADNLTISRVFQVTVNAVNDLPTLDPIGDQFINEDAPQQSINLTGISAGGGETQPLRVKASSSNTALIPTPNVSYSTANSTGTLRYTPAPNQFGEAYITVTVEDGGFDGNLDTPADNASFSRTFLVTVNPVNEPPTLDPIADITLQEDASETVVDLFGITAGGIRSQPLRVTATSSNTALIPNPSVNYTSANQTGSIRFTPVANAFGVATITVTVEDGGLDGLLNTPGDNATFSQTFKVTVNPVNDLPTIDPIPDLTINEDSGPQTVYVSGVTAGGNESQPRRVILASSNTALIPTPTFNFTAIDSQTGMIKFTPVPDQFGFSIITVTVEDGGLDYNLATAGDNATFSRTFKVTVNPINEPPTLAPISDLTIQEDSLETFIDLLGISAGGIKVQPLRVTAMSADSTLISPPNVNYQSPNSTGSLGIKPLLNRSGNSKVTVTVEDGGLDQDLSTIGDNATFSRTFTVKVLPVNDSPRVNDFGVDVAYTENGPAVPISPNAKVVDPDSTTFAGGKLTVSLINNARSGDQLVILPTGFLTVTSNSLIFAGKTIGLWSGGTGGVPLKVDFIGDAFINRVQHVLQNIAFQSVSDDPGSSPRLVVVELTDGSGGSTADTFRPEKQILVTPINDVPVLSNFGGNLTYTEGSAAIRIASGVVVTDPDSPNFGGGEAVISLVSGAESTDRLMVLPTTQLAVNPTQLLFSGKLVATYSGGMGTTPLTFLFTSDATREIVQQVLQNVAFLSVADEPGLALRVVNFQVADGDGGTSSVSGKTIQVLPSNDAPVISGLGGPVNYVEDATPVRIAASATVFDIDSPNFAGGFLRINFQSGSQAGDELQLLAADGITINGSGVLLNSVQIGTISGGLSGVPLQVNFNASATTAAAQQVLRNIAFRHLGDTPSSQPRMLGILLYDGNGASSAPLTQQVNVTPVNDAPVLGGVSGTQYYPKNSAPVFIAGGATVSDADNSNFANGKLIVRITGGANKSNRLLIGGGFGIDANNGIWWQGVKVGTRNTNGGLEYTNLEVTFNANATTAVVQQLMRSIQFQTVKARSYINRNIEFLLLDSAGGVSNIVSKQVTFKRI